MFPSCDAAAKTSNLSQEVGPSQSMILATKTVILSQTIIFFGTLTKW